MKIRRKEVEGEKGNRGGFKGIRRVFRLCEA
jgi:hypothetical protein